MKLFITPNLRKRPRRFLNSTLTQKPATQDVLQKLFQHLPQKLLERNRPILKKKIHE